MLDKEKLIKVLRKTESASDGEALSAIRMANKMVADQKMTWEHVFNLQTKKSASSMDYVKDMKNMAEYMREWGVYYDFAEDKSFGRFIRSMKKKGELWKDLLVDRDIDVNMAQGVLHTIVEDYIDSIRGEYKVFKNRTELMEDFSIQLQAWKRIKG